MTNPKHTTAEYLAWIDKKIIIAQANIKIYEIENLKAIQWLEEYPNSENGKYYAENTRFMLQDWKERLAQSLANRDVLVRHFASSEPDDYETIGCLACGYDSEYGQYLQKFPCPTVLDIAQRLDEVM